MVNHERAIEIATMALHRLIEIDADSAQRFMIEEIDMSEEEHDDFCVKRKRKATDIIWETDGEDVDLPSEVDIPWDVLDDDVADYLSDKYVFLVDAFVLEDEDE